MSRSAAEEYDARYWDERAWFFENPRIAIFHSRAIHALNAVNVLDAGCGTGTVVDRLRSTGIPAVGVDASRTALQRCPSGQFLREGSLEWLPYSDRSFDVVYTTEVLEHIHTWQLDWVIGELCRTSARLVAGTINFTDPTDPTHHTLRPRIWWDRRFREHGFEVAQELRDRVALIPAPLPFEVVVYRREVGPRVEIPGARISR